MEDKRSFRIPLYSGLLTDGHPVRIGGAIWVFLWMIDKTTEEKDIDIEGKNEKLGVVLNGEPVSHKKIAAELKTSEDTIMRNLALLEKERYIIAQRHSFGKVYFVRKSKKWDERYRKPAVSSTPDTAKVRYHKPDDTANLRHRDTAKVRYQPCKALLLSTTTPNTINKLPELHSTTEPPLPPLPNFSELKNQFQTAWNLLAREKGLAKVISIPKTRENKLRSRFQEETFRQNLEKIFTEIKDSAFLLGENERNWKIDFDWLIENDRNYLKVLEGKYKNKEAQYGRTGARRNIVDPGSRAAFQRIDAKAKQDLEDDIRNEAGGTEGKPSEDGLFPVPKL